MNKVSKIDTLTRPKNNKLYLMLKSSKHNFSLFSLLRYLESQDSFQDDVFGKSVSASDENIRIIQTPNLSFPPSEIRDINVAQGKITIDVASFGLMSINSPLPSFLLEYIFQRQHHFGDKTWAAFLNMLQHRLFTLFYRSWANSQSILFLENPSYNRFNTYIASLSGIAHLTLDEDKNYVSKYSKLYFSGFLLQAKSAINLVKLLSQYFQTPFALEENIGEWCKAPENEQMVLSSTSKYNLGDGLLIGSNIYNKSSKIRIIVGPLEFNGYTSFFEGGSNYLRLCEWMDFYLGKDYNWELQPILSKTAIPNFELGVVELGKTCWLGNPDDDGHDYIAKNANAI